MSSIDSIRSTYPTPSKGRLLCVVAHPDDETMLTGGMLAMLAERGVEVHVLCATRGEGGETGGIAVSGREELGRIRESELRCAAAALGAHSVRFLDYVDPPVAPKGELYAFRAEPAELEGHIVEAVRRLSPDVLLTHGSQGEYGHPGHILVHCSVLRAHRAIRGRVEASAPAVYTFCAAIPGRRDRIFNTADPAHIVLDVSPWLEIKSAAAACHRTQHELFFRNHPEARTFSEVLRKTESLHRVWTADGEHAAIFAHLAAPPPTIELAPRHKSGLALTNAVMPTAGCFGLGTEYIDLVETEALGAIVVGPVTGRRRRGAAPPRALPAPDGVLLHTGLANPGVATVLRRCGRAWSRSPVPVIVHVAGTSPRESASCCRRLAELESVAGIELGLPDGLDYDDAAAIVEAARAAALHPLVVRLPLAEADVLCELAVESGADALTVAAPPRGAIWHAPTGRFVTGRLYGRSVLPQAIRVLRRVSELVAVPLIGCGGIHSPEDARAFLCAGAVAVQVGGAVWRDPACLTRIARALHFVGEDR